MPPIMKHPKVPVIPMGLLVTVKLRVVPNLLHLELLSPSPGPVLSLATSAHTTGT